MPTNPYAGLRPFDVGDYENFFGRDRQIDELLVRLRDHRFVAVVGLSGSGKSSLVRAGLIHRLEVGHLSTAARSWRVALFRPGSKPIEAMAAALDDALGKLPGRVEQLRGSTRELLRGTRDGRQPNEALLIVVDQFEEIFRFLRETNLSLREATHFVELLLAAEQDLAPEYPVYVVLTMRSDALGNAAYFDGLPEVLNRSQYLVPRMTQEQFLEAIQGPAALTDTSISPDVVQTLLAEAAEGEDRLPLIQHLLMMLWNARTPTADGGWEITTAALRALKGPEEALNDHADRVWNDLPSDAAKTLAAMVLKQLTEIIDGREQRRPARISRLVELTGGTAEDIVRVTQPFFDANFLASPDGPTVADREIDITHECLIRQWQRLRTWAKEEADDRDKYCEFARRAERGGGLLAGTDLKLALEWLDKKYTAAWARRYAPNYDETVAFILRSRSSFRLRAVAVGVALLLGLVGLMWFQAYRQQDELERSRQQQLLDAEREQRRIQQRYQEQLTAERTQAAEQREREARERAGKLEDLNKNLVAANTEVTVERNLANRRQRIILTQLLATEAKDADEQGMSERVALFARRAFLVHQQSPDAPRRYVQDALLRASAWPIIPTHLVGQKSGNLAVAFSVKDAVAVGGSDGRIRVWTSGSGEGRSIAPPSRGRDPQAHNGPVNAVTFSEDGSRLVSGGEDGRILIWNLTGSGTPRTLQHKGPVNAVAISAGGIIVSGSDDQTVGIWSLTDTKDDGERIEYPAAVDAVAISRDGRLIAAAGGEGLIQLWDARKPLEPLSVDFSVASLTFTSDGRRVIAGGSDGSIQSWDVRGGESRTWAGPEGNVTSISLSADGRFLVSGHDDGTILLWRADDPDVPPLTLAERRNPVGDVAFSRAGPFRLVSAHTDLNAVRLWELPVDELVPQGAFYGHSDWVKTVAFSRDGRRLASGGDDNRVIVWSVREMGRRLMFEHDDDVTGVTFLPGGNQVASASLDGTVRLWNLENPGATPRALNHEVGVTAVAASWRSRLLASGDEDGDIRLWTLADPSPSPIVLSGHEQQVTSLVFSPNDDYLASASEDDTVRVWSLNNPKAEPLVLKGHAADVEAVAFSPDGRLVASGADDMTVRVWQWQSKAAPIVLRGHEAAVYGISFSADGTIASASWDQTVRLWRPDTPDELPVVIADHANNDVNAVAFSPDGEWLASGADDNTVRVRPLWANAADRLCASLGSKDLTLAEWRRYLGNDFKGAPPTCPAGARGTR